MDGKIKIVIKADSVITGAYLNIHGCPKPTKQEALPDMGLLLGQGSIILYVIVSIAAHNLQ